MYTIEDLKGKYVKAGTQEAEVFLGACKELGATYKSNITTECNFMEALINCFGGLVIYGFNLESSAEENSTPFTPKQEWSIYTNDKPLSELTDEQVGRLVKCSGAIEYMDTMTLEWRESVLPLWNRNDAYRAKQKSERELFIEAAMQLMTSETERTLEQQFGALFDSGKFKMVKDGE